jgi:hypothetical protein
MPSASVSPPTSSLSVPGINRRAALARTRGAGQDEHMPRRRDADVAIRSTDLSVARA